MPHIGPLRVSALAVALIAAPLALTTPAHSVTGTAAADSAYAFTAKLDIGDGDTERACSATLIYTDWLLTAASCFAADPAVSLAVPSGPPAWATTATIGRTDLTATTGQVRTVVELIPHPDQDLVLAKLASPVTGITPVGLSASPPAAGEELRVAGYGRTKDEWAPLKLHTGAFTVNTVNATDVAVTGKDGVAVCAGDTGGPLLSDVTGTPQLVGVNSRSWQGGCFGVDSTETRTGAIDTRIDTLRTWITSNAGPVCNSQGALYSMVGDGSLLRRNVDDPMNGTGTVPASSVIDTGWQDYGRVLAGTSATFYGIKSDGMYLSHRVAATATWDIHHRKISSSYTTYNTPANHNRITTDRGGHLWYIDDTGGLRWSQYDQATGTWLGTKIVDTGWGAYTHIFGADNGVLYAIDPSNGHLVRSRYDFTSQRWIQHQATVNTADWRDTKEITSFGGDTIVRIKTGGEIRHYRYNEATGVFDSWNKLIGSGTNWPLYTSITAAPDNCRLRADHTPALPAVDIDRSSGPDVLQTSTGAIEYATTDSNGRLLYGLQPNPADFSTLQWTTGPDTELFAGQPQIAEQPDGKVAVAAQTTTGSMWWRRHTATSPAWGAWTDLAGAMKGHPAVSKTPDGLFGQFVIDSDGTPWYALQARANVDYLGWIQLPGNGFAGPLTAVTVRNGIQLFGTGADGQLRTATFQAGTLTAWTTIGTQKITGAPSVVVHPDRRLGVFARGTDGHVVSTVQTAEGSAFPAWTQVADLTATGAPSAVLDSATGYTQVVARAADGTIRHTHESTRGTYSTWQASTQAGAEVSATDPTAFTYTAGTTSTWAYAVRTDAGTVHVTQAP
ncbi:tachylectin-related carbohydrate-binding protein [Streptomyces sp. NPDC046977]|uniref:tachylectin-related carbohydrate-binding protein n=1 Tax=Streptomyces sp. NPDC046977 TaxID=3154703 RepID=UPI0033DCD9DA